MATFRLVKGLPYGAPGDAVEMQVVDDVAHFVHYGIADAKRRKTTHAGQFHSWDYRLPGKEIRNVKVTVPEQQAKGGLIDRFLGKDTDRKGQGQAEVEASLNGKLVTIVIQGGERDIQQLGQQLTRLKSAIQRNIPPPNWRD